MHKPKQALIQEVVIQSQDINEKLVQNQPSNQKLFKKCLFKKQLYKLLSQKRHQHSFKKQPHKLLPERDISAKIVFSYLHFSDFKNKRFFC